MAAAAGTLVLRIVSRRYHGDDEYLSRDNTSVSWAELEFLDDLTGSPPCDVNMTSCSNVTSLDDDSSTYPYTVWQVSHV